MTRPRVALGLLLLAVVAVGGSAGHDAAVAALGERRLRSLAPGLEPDLAHHHLDDSDGDWLAYCRRVGTAPLRDAHGVLGQELRTASYQEFLARRKVLDRSQLRIAQAFTRVFKFPLAEQDARQLVALTPQAGFALRQADRHFLNFGSETRFTPDERIQIAEAFAEAFVALGFPDRAVSAHHFAARRELDLGRRDRHRVRLQTALRLAREAQDIVMICELLGELGSIHYTAGHKDSMRLCYDEGIAVAERHGLYDQAARLHQFSAIYMTYEGRLAPALDRLAEAQRLCGLAGIAGARLRLQIRHTKLMAELGRWDLVERSLRGIPPLLREFRRSDRGPEARKYTLDADRIRARHGFATGHSERASRLLRYWSDSLPPDARRQALAGLYDEWSAGLEDGGDVAGALEACGRGLAHCDTAYGGERALYMRLRKARLLVRLNRIPEATVALDSAEAFLNRYFAGPEPMQRETAILRARLLARRGQKAAASQQIHAILRQFQAGLRADGDQLGYLELDGAASLRSAIHEIERFGPAAGYRFEMEWRSLSRELGGDRRARTPGPSPAVASGRAPATATHLVYKFTENVLLRWTASRGRVVLDTLPISATDCLVQVRDAIGLLQHESPPLGRYLGPEALRKLLPLSRVLLPASLGATRSDPMPLYVSPDGPLQALPFEALPGPGGEPLASWADVAYVRGWDSRARRSGGSVVVVSNPSLSSHVRRRIGLGDSLSGSEAESRAALERWPGAVQLSGVQATKDSVLARWPGASVIYLSTHHVRDPDAPYLGFIPLAVPEGAPADRAFLETVDIFAVDLSACRLAVLASCSSGAPYRLALRPGPSLGDAFLDSGAAAVVQSLWDVGDDEASGFMRALLSTWREDGDDAAALGRARREVMSTPRGASPRVWAAWSVHRVLPADIGSIAAAK